MKEKKTRILKILISVILMIILLSQIEYGEMKTVFDEVKVSALLIAVISYFISIWINAIKWKVLLPNTKLSFLTYLCFRAQFYSTVLPGQLFGEASKLTVWKNQKEDATRVTASVFYDKITGIIGQMIIAIVGFSFSMLGKKSNGRWLLLGIVSAFLIIIWFSAEPHIASIIRKIIIIITNRKKSVGTKLEEFYDAWCYFSNDKKVLLMSVLWGIINQLMGNVMIYYLSQMLGLEVGFLDYCWINPMLSLILLIPISFAGIGLRDASLSTILLLYDVPAGKSFVISSSLLLGQVAAAIIGGIMTSLSNIVYKKDK